MKRAVRCRYHKYWNSFKNVTLWTIKICFRSSFAACQKILWNPESCMQQPSTQTWSVHHQVEQTAHVHARRLPLPLQSPLGRTERWRAAASCGRFDSTCSATLITNVDGLERLSVDRSFAPCSQWRSAWIKLGRCKVMKTSVGNSLWSLVFLCHILWFSWWNYLPGKQIHCLYTQCLSTTRIE